MCDIIDGVVRYMCCVDLRAIGFAGLRLNWLTRPVPVLQSRRAEAAERAAARWESQTPTGADGGIGAFFHSACWHGRHQSTTAVPSTKRAIREVVFALGFRAQNTCERLSRPVSPLQCGKSKTFFHSALRHAWAEPKHYGGAKQKSAPLGRRD